MTGSTAGITSFSVSRLPAIEMAVVFSMVNNVGGDAGWRPALLLVQGRSFQCKEATLRHITEMNAKPGRKQSPVVLFAGFGPPEMQAASLAAEHESANIHHVSAIGAPATLITGLSADTFETVLNATSEFGPDPLDVVWNEGLFLCKGWPLRYLQSHTHSSDSDQGDVLPQNSKRLCVAWGLSQEQLDAALQSATELRADIQAWSYGPYGGEVLFPDPNPFDTIYCCLQALVQHRTTDQHTDHP